MNSLSPSIREQIVGRERSAFAEQNTKTRLLPTTKQRRRVGKQNNNIITLCNYVSHSSSSRHNANNPYFHCTKPKQYKSTYYRHHTNYKEL